MPSRARQGKLRNKNQSNSPFFIKNLRKIYPLREALINALCHRDYDIHQCSIGIAIYDDRIEIESPGLLPHELTPKTIKLSRQSFPRNEVLANVLYQTTYLEKWGSGVKRIIEVCEEEGSPEPFWTEEAGYTVVTFPLARLNGRKVLQNVPQNVAQNVTQDIDDSPRVQKVEQIILVDSMKTKEFLAKMFGVSTRTILRDLKKLGYAWEGALKNGRWVREKGRLVDTNKTSVKKVAKRIGK